MEWAEASEQYDEISARVRRLETALAKHHKKRREVGALISATEDLLYQARWEQMQKLQVLRRVISREEDLGE